MIKLKQWLNKISTLTFVIIIFALTFLYYQLNIEKNSTVAFLLGLPFLLLYIILVFRLLNYLKAKGSGWYHFFRFFFGYLLICFPAGLLIALDLNFNLKGFLMIPGLVLEVGLLIWLFIKYRFKHLGIKHSLTEKSSNSYSFENLCDDLSADIEIEFTYDNFRFLFIPENGRYYFKRIVSADPYEYEILAEAEDPLTCIDLAVLNGKKISGVWPDVKDIKVY